MLLMAFFKLLDDRCCEHRRRKSLHAEKVRNLLNHSRRIATRQQTWPKDKALIELQTHGCLVRETLCLHIHCQRHQRIVQ